MSQSRKRKKLRMLRDQLRKQRAAELKAIHDAQPDRVDIREQHRQMFRKDEQ